MHEWGDVIDRSIIIGHLMNEALRCSGCGGYLDETTDGARAQLVHDDTICHRCAAMSAHREALEKKEPDGKPGRLMWAETVDIPQDE